MTQNEKESQSGFATLVLTLVISLISSILLFNSINQMVKNRAIHVREIDSLLLNEMTMSTFSVMEAALARRMWEPPPDAQCLKSESFEVQGTFDNGMTWKVEAKYRPKANNFEMIATGVHKSLKAKYKKYMKVMDASDFLLYSASDKDLQLGRIFDLSTPTSLIAKDRRIFSRGKVVFYSVIEVTPPLGNPKLDFNGRPAQFPGTYGTIIQGDRMQFHGGLHYLPQIVPEPSLPPETPFFMGMLTPFANAWGTPITHYAQTGGGVAVLTRDYLKASQLVERFTNPAVPINKVNIAANVYPMALFGGVPPLRAWTGADTGAYFNDPDRFSIFYYTYGDINHFGIRADFTCFSEVNAFTGGKFCSFSEHFPLGFKQWRTNAGLDGVLFTADSEDIPSPKLNWDNLQALEEDANQCGYVLGAPNAGAYKDCHFWEKGFMSSYRAANGADICGHVSPLNLDLVALNNFNDADLVDPLKKDWLLRRVVYLKVPTEIAQTSADGLMTTLLPNSAKRKNLSLWIVSEDLLALRGLQPDLSSPLTVDPGRLRKIYFNFDTVQPLPALKKQPLPLVLFSPEQVHLISPQYLPMSYASMLATFPVIGAQVRPVRHIRTDYLRHENDGFKFGYRQYSIHDTTLITSSNVSPGSPFFLRGLWSGPDSSDSQYIRNLCMVSQAGTPFSINADAVNVSSNYIMPGGPNSPVPPPGSNYFSVPGVPAVYPRAYYPQVFLTQIANGDPGRQESEVTLSGLRIFSDFEPPFPVGKRDLSVLKYRPINYPSDFSF
jgi:hypothetical protein